jgi:hypothetical protein
MDSTLDNDHLRMQCTACAECRSTALFTQSSKCLVNLHFGLPRGLLREEVVVSMFRKKEFPMPESQAKTEWLAALHPAGTNNLEQPFQTSKLDSSFGLIFNFQACLCSSHLQLGLCEWPLANTPSTIINCHRSWPWRVPFGCEKTRSNCQFSASLFTSGKAHLFRETNKSP